MTKLTQPVLFISGDRDPFAPVGMTQLLYEKLMGKRRDLLVVKAAHAANCWKMGQSAYLNKIRMFIARYR